MHKKFEINQTKIKGSCQSGRKVVTHNSKSDLPLYLPPGHHEDIVTIVVERATRHGMNQSGIFDMALAKARVLFGLEKRQGIIYLDFFGTK